MALELKFRRINHPVQCSVNGCKSRDTYMVNRGSGRDDPVHLCGDCIAEIALKYAERIGAERARVVFGRIFELICDNLSGIEILGIMKPAETANAENNTAPAEENAVNMNANEAEAAGQTAEKAEDKAVAQTAKKAKPKKDGGE